MRCGKEWTFALGRLVHLCFLNLKIPRINCPDPFISFVLAMKVGNPSDSKLKTKE